MAYSPGRMRTLLMATATVATLAQAVPPPFGMTEAAARKLLLETIQNGGFPNDYMAIVGVVQRAYDRMPAAARGPATTAAFAWAKSFVQSPAFAAAWAAVREEHRPAGSAPAESIDAEARRIIDEKLAVIEQTRQVLATLNLPPAERAKNLAQLQAQEDELKRPDTFKQHRDAVAMVRGAVSAESAGKLASWEETYPADLNVMVKRALKNFLDSTATVDFSIPTIWVKNAAGQTLGFLSPGLTDLPWEHIFASAAGREALAAARAASEAWLKELGGR